MVVVVRPEVAGAVAGDERGGRQGPSKFEDGAAGHGSLRGYVCSNARDNVRRVAVVAGTGVAGDEQYDIAGGGVFRASNGNGDAARYWANGRAGRGLRAGTSTTARARDQRVTGRLPAMSAGGDAYGSSGR